MNILSLHNVSKQYEKHVAVNDVSFDMPEGCIMGLLGPNGAGKTSLIRIITMITGADSGRVLFNGEPLIASHQANIGYMPEERGLYKKMKIGEQLLYLAQLKGMSYTQAREEIIYWFKKFDIADWWNKRVEELSKGMQQKVQFIATVMHRPRLLILDEPLSGLDPINSNLINSEIAELKNKGTSIIFSTHRMEQVEEMCEHIVLINNGRNILTGSVSDIKNKFKENLYRIDFDGALPADFAQHFTVREQSPSSAVIQIDTTEARQHPNDAIRYLLQRNIEIRKYYEMLPTFNEIFIKQVAANNLELVA
ncbi:MAG: ATP-binding cassette domain-containing protein [Saprospiraceae bacterium]|nr:ATP-binding cassette domain-containing protein [Saprospiraceae bacterium]MBP7679876.1 ATP-binding cassette domain-containing protein [Saprospiraceae bacterium]